MLIWLLRNFQCKLYGRTHDKSALGGVVNPMEYKEELFIDTVG